MHTQNSVEKLGKLMLRLQENYDLLLTSLLRSYRTRPPVGGQHTVCVQGFLPPPSTRTMADNAPQRQSPANSWQNHDQRTSSLISSNNILGGDNQLQSSAAPVPTRNPPRKATKRRKCFVPVGPAGVWFQAQEHPGRKLDTDHEEDGHEFSDHATTCTSSQQEPVSSASFCSPGWTAAQCALGISTPSLPPYWSQEKKYDVMKSHMPSGYLLLHDVLQGQTDWVAKQRLLLQVSSIQSVTANDHLWTAILEDETGTTLTAWIQPELVRKEQQNNKWVRVGNVWLLEGCTIYLIPQTESWDRILLVGESNLREMWSPAAADSVPTKEYIAWMEARNLLSSSLLGVDPEDRQMPPGGAERAQWSDIEGVSDKGDDDDDDDHESAGDMFAPRTAAGDTPAEQPLSSTESRSSRSRGPSSTAHIPSPMSASVSKLPGEAQRGIGDASASQPLVSKQLAQKLTEGNDRNGDAPDREAAVVTPTTAQASIETSLSTNMHSTESETSTDEDVVDHTTLVQMTNRATPLPAPSTQLGSTVRTSKAVGNKRKRKTPILFTEEAARHLSNDSTDEEDSSMQKNRTARRVTDSDDWSIVQTSTDPSMLFCPSAFEGLDIDLDG